MAVREVKQEAQEKGWRQYLLISIGILLTVLLAGGVFYFWEEIQQAEGYGYAGGFVVSLLGGITIIPVPSLLVIFTLGHALNPVYVGLVSGLGEALGGITVYLTGAGGGAIWSKLRSRQQVVYNQSSSEHHSSTPVESEVWSKGQTFYNRLVGLVGRRGSFWVVFAASAMIVSPFYFAGLAAGTLRMDLKKFFLASWAGKTVKGLCIASAGYWGLHLLLQWFGA